MLGDKDLLNVNFGDKTSFLGQVEQTKFLQVLQQKDKEIKTLKRTIKRLNKELKQKNQIFNLPSTSQGVNSNFKIVIEREINRYNELKQYVLSLGQRMKKLSQELDQEFSLSQNSSDMENIVKMLEMANVSSEKISKNMLQSQSSSQYNEQIEQVQHTIDDFEIKMRSLSMKFGQTNKFYRQNLILQKQLQEEISHYKRELKNEKKGKDLLQKLLERNETEKNELVNQINSIVGLAQLQELKAKTKQEILNYCYKLNYRIKDLEREKQDYIKSSTREMQKQVKLYEALLKQVKDMKDRSRIRQSIA